MFSRGADQASLVSIFAGTGGKTAVLLVRISLPGNLYEGVRPSVCPVILFQRSS
jgi:hypothetical protein